MISQLKQQDIELWEAWVEYDHVNSEFFGTLYVIGEILVDQKSSQPSIKKRGNIGEQRQLVLQIPERPSGRCRMIEVSYAEPIKNLNEYASICIYAGGELIVRFDEIEVLI